MYPYRLFGSICSKKNILPANVSLFHNRLETVSVKLHCYVCADVAHGKKLDYIRPNQFLGLQIKFLRMSECSFCLVLVFHLLDNVQSNIIF